jgi:5-hydroxyisourate hydrolase
MSGGNGWLSTHVLDTANGCPAAGIAIRLFEIDGQDRRMLAEAITNEDGRTDTPLIAKGDLKAGIYEIEFAVGAYFGTTGGVAFLDKVPIRFGIADPEEHYHIPLLVSPFGFSTYRGS